MGLDDLHGGGRIFGQPGPRADGFAGVLASRLRTDDGSNIQTRVQRIERATRAFFTLR